MRSGLVVAAEAATKRREWEQALALWRTVATLDGDALSPSVAAPLANIQRKLGRHDEAERTLRTALRDSPDDPQLLSTAAAVANARKDWRGTAERLRELARARGGDTPPNLAIRLARAYCMAGQYADAGAALRDAAERHPSHPAIGKATFLAPGLRRTLAAECGLSHALLTGARFQVHRRDRYHIRLASRALLDPDPTRNSAISKQLSAIRVHDAGQFANSLIKLSNAISAARALGCGTVYFPEVWFADSGAHRLGDGLNLVFTGSPPLHRHDAVLEGSFLFTETLRPVLPPDATPLEAIPDIRHLINVTASGPPLSSDELVIHLRGGDVFRGNGAHPSYGQPPLAFYTAIIRHGSWRKVAIVFQDKANPVVAPLIDFCERHCQVVRTISGDLDSDLSFLLRARTIVMGRGTFVPAVSALSANISDLIYFNDIYHRSIMDFEAMYRHRRFAHVGVHRARERGTRYLDAILSANWRNSEAQRTLMVDHPESAISLEEVTALLDPPHAPVPATAFAAESARVPPDPIA